MRILSRRLFSFFLFVAWITGVGTIPAKAGHWEATVNGSTIAGTDGCSVATAFANALIGSGAWIPISCNIDPSGYAYVAACYYNACPDGLTDSKRGVATFTCDSGEYFASGGCYRPDSGSERQSKTCVGNPIDIMSGRKLETVEDFSSAGPDPMVLSRHYAHYPDMLARRFSTASLGTGWKTNFDARLFYSSASQVFIGLPDGRELAMLQQPSGEWTHGRILNAGGSGMSWVSRPGMQETLVRNGSQFVLSLTDGRVLIFDPAVGETGSVKEIRYAGGYQQTLTYTTTQRWTALASVADNRGRQLTFAHDIHGRISEATFNSTIVARYTYLPKTDMTIAPPGTPDLLIAVLGKAEYPTASEYLEYSYGNSAFRFAMTGVKDGRGVINGSWTYDSAGYATSSQHAGGADLTQVSYGANSITVTNPLGKQSSFSSLYAPEVGTKLQSQVDGVASANCPASTTSYQYDSNFHVSQETDAEGRITTYVNDAATGLPTSITRGFGTSSATTTSLTWNSTWRVPTQVVEPGLTTDLVWDTAGKLTSVTQTDTTSQTVPFSTNGRTRAWTYGYDANGKLTSVDGPLAGTGDTMSYTYNAQGFVQTMTNEVGHVTTVTAWNFRGQPTSVTDPNGVVTTYAYDGMGRVTSVVVDPASDPKTWTLTYTLAGDLATFAEPKGAVYSLTWDDARRLMAIQNNLGERLEYDRDAMGNITQRRVKDNTGGVNFIENSVVDELGRLIRQSTYPAMEWRFAYDRTDLLKNVTDPRGKIVSYGYDPVKRAITETERDTGVTTLGYNGKDEITSYKDPKNLSTTYVRNGFGEVIQETSPDRGITKYDHDARGLMITTTDARNVVTNFTYDNAGRLLTKSYPSSATLNVTFTYDSVAGGNYGKGRQTGMTDSAGSATYRYDAKGHMVQEVRTISGIAHTIIYNYGGSGKLWDITYPSGRKIRFGYDDLGRKNYVDLKRDAAATEEPILNWVGYLPFGKARGFTLANGLFRWDSYDAEYRLEASQLFDANASIWENWPWWGADGMNLMTLTDGIDTTKTQTFTYDDVGRLASANGAYGARGHTYDKVGNRLTEVITPSGGSATTQTYAYTSGKNRLANVKQGTTTLRAFVYDAAGNMTRDTRGSTQYNYTISAAGRISEVKVGTQLRATYLYDGRSRLVSSVRVNVANAGTTRYLHDSEDRIIAEVDATGTTLREYVWLDDMPVAVLDGSSNPANPTLFWVQADHLNRPVVMYNAAQAVMWKAFYEPFGAAHSITGPAANDNRFPGQLFQLESGLSYNWHRHYDATIGRYTQVDPLSTETRELVHLNRPVGSTTPGPHGRQALSFGDLAGLITRFELSPDSTSASNVARVSTGRPDSARWVFPDGPSRYNYARQNPMKGTDPSGLFMVGDGFTPIPNPHLENCTDAPSMLLNDMRLHRHRGGDVCWALGDLRGRGVWGNDELRRAEKYFKCRGSSLSR